MPDTLLEVRDLRIQFPTNDGLVKAVDPAAGTATISVTGVAGAKSVVVHTSQDTVIRRCDAIPRGLLHVVHCGIGHMDQLGAIGRIGGE